MRRGFVGVHPAMADGGNGLMPKCSFIMSAYDQPEHLVLALYSLKLQSENDFEVIVCDNSPDQRNALACNYVADSRVRHLWTGKTCGSCYESANLAAREAEGDFLCFPSCDNYYVPQFLETMLRQRGVANLIYCDMLYDPRGPRKQYAVIDVQPVCGHIDKGGFLIHRHYFQPFPWQRNAQGLGAADGMLIQDLVTSGVSHGKAPGVLWVHN